MSRGLGTVSWNLALSFSPLLAAGGRGEARFWPGCAALKLGDGLLQKTRAALAESVPGLGLCTWCCGKPAQALGGEAVKKYHGRVSRFLQKEGVKTLYTLCPNCTATLPGLFEGEVISAWPLLAQYADEHKEGPPFLETCILHDPCMARRDEACQKAARQILQAREVRAEEFAQNGENTLCCGRKDMLFLTDPAASTRMLHRRVQEAGPRAIASYCESCTEAFLGAGNPAVHLLEILFNTPGKRQFSSRLAAAQKEKWHVGYTG